MALARQIFLGSLRATSQPRILTFSAAIRPVVAIAAPSSRTFGLLARLPSATSPASPVCGTPLKPVNPALRVLDRPRNYAAQSVKDDEGPEAPPPRGEGTIARLTREYGRIAVVVYSCLTFTVFVLCYVAVASLGVDVHWILEKFHELRANFGWNRTESEREQSASVKKSQDDSAEAKTKPAFFSMANWLLALALTKVFVPVKLLATTAITPSIARILRARGWEVGTRKVRDIRPKPDD